MYVFVLRCFVVRSLLLLVLSVDRCVVSFFYRVYIVVVCLFVDATTVATEWAAVALGW